MKLYIKNIFLVIFVALILSGCGGGGGSEASFQNARENRVLQINEPIQVYTGDSIIESSEDTTIKVTHELGADTKTVTLLTGSATLIRGNYEPTK